MTTTLTLPFAAIIALVVGCGGGANGRQASQSFTTGGQTSVSSDAGTGGRSHQGELLRLRVDGNKIVDSAGNELVLRGLGLGEAMDVDNSGHWNEDYFRKAGEWGAQIVRLPINPATYRLGSDRVAAYVDQAVTWGRKYGLYVIVDWHVVGNLPQRLFIYDASATTLDETRAFWTFISQRYANEPVVAFYEIYNEPAAIEWQGGNWSFADWKITADSLVTLVRSASPDTIPILAGMNFAYDYSAGGQKPFDSTGIALAVHPYPGRATPPRRPAWDKAFGYLSDSYPLLLTEVGFDPCDQITSSVYRADLDYGREILSYTAEKGMGWTAFVFFNLSYYPMPLFTEWQTYTPTVSGSLFRDVLLGAAIDQAGTPGTGCAADAAAP